jgi:DNA-directed RNA polymerase subunit RPC12/RpoP
MRSASPGAFVHPAGMDEQDFVIAMATAQGHLHPEVTRTIACQSCGAEFLMAPEALSLTCPYCNSLYVVENAGSRELVAPSGLIPFQFDRQRARKLFEDHLREWGDSAPLPPGAPQALYQPAWCFTISGQAPWNCLRYVNRRWAPDSGSKIVFIRDVLISASPKVKGIFPRDIPGYTLSALVPYDGRYLADWPAETYQVSMSDASLQAREFALEEARKQIQAAFLEETRNLNVSSAEITIESFKLVLLPVWTARISRAGQPQQIMLNGQSGTIWGDKPGVKGLFKRLFH